MSIIQFPGNKVICRKRIFLNTSSWDAKLYFARIKEIHKKKNIYIEGFVIVKSLMLKAMISVWNKTFISKGQEKQIVVLRFSGFDT